MKQASTPLSVHELAAVSGGKKKKSNFKKGFRCNLAVMGGTLAGAATGGFVGAFVVGAGAALSAC